MDIVCVAFAAFDGNYVKSTVELMRELAPEHRILYVDYCATWKDVAVRLVGQKKGLSLGRVLGLKPRLQTRKLDNGGTVFLLTPPPVLPINFVSNLYLYSLLMRLNGWLVKKAILKAMRQLSISNPVVINAFNPFLGVELAGKLQESKLIYYCYDEISACTWTSNHGGRLEEQLIAKVDAVVVSSEGLLRAKQKFGKPCFVVKNGVKTNQFSIKKELPPRPQLGFVGSIDNRLDYELLLDVATQNPDKELVMVGREVALSAAVLAKITQLKARPNVRFEGPKMPNELPKYMSQFSVGLIPFLKNPQTATIYPMKINEYLSAGLPVISTQFAPLEEFTTVVDFADNHSTFCEKVEWNIQNDSFEKQLNRRAFSEQNTWTARANQLQETILAV